ncbi:AraC family transcriptional regulator [Sphingomonas folli]|uniref:AraC family transcriptional regulator n=1 Tax=Sphingomonas folli TaxID=2862497 RepID=UPI00215620CA|nr:AraC family transcriptional regulator [Sphingomonas folli]
MSAALDLMEARGGGQGRFDTGMPGVLLVRSFQTIMPVPNIYKPSLCIVFKGAKQIMFGDRTLDYAEMECLVINVEVPAVGRMVGATPATPYVGMTIEFDTAILRELLQQVPAPPRSAAATPSIFVGQVDEQLAECLTRLVRLMSNPGAVPVLSPAMMREIHYWLLTGPYGAEIAKLAAPETHAERVARAIHYVRDHLAEPIRVEQLAAVANMSSSSFHHHFKTMTSMSPVQYQKQLRLVEARRLMLSEAANVAEAAYHVGYESASQFSREYSRSFGIAPKRDVLQFRELLAQATAR